MLYTLNSYSTQSLSCVRLCDPTDRSPPDSSVHGISQARILEWVATYTPKDLPDPGIELRSLASPAMAGVFFTTVPPIESWRWLNGIAMKMISFI